MHYNNITAIATSFTIPYVHRDVHKNRREKKLINATQTENKRIKKITKSKKTSTSNEHDYVRDLTARVGIFFSS